MNIEMLRHFFAWCAVINYAMLLLWFFLPASAAWATPVNESIASNRNRIMGVAFRVNAAQQHRRRHFYGQTWRNAKKLTRRLSGYDITSTL